MAENNHPTSLDIHLKRISKIVQNWPGETLGRCGTLRVLNAQGTKPPVFWCFNSAGEFPALARALGPDQPLVGMRSLNQVLEPSAITSKELRELGEYYATQLSDAFGTAPCIVGGNCQSAPIAYAVALWLQTRATQVLYLVTLDAALHRPYPGEMRMLFGRNSALRNPFFGQEIDLNTLHALKFRCAIKTYRPAIVDGGHGEYFLPDNIASLASAISAPSVARTSKAAIQKLPIWKVVEGDDDHVVLSTPKSKCESSDFAVVPIWTQSGEITRLLGDDWVVYPKENEADFVCKIKKPDGDGAWVLRLVICQADIGPCTWPIDNFQAIIFDGSDNNGTSRNQPLTKGKFKFALWNLLCKCKKKRGKP
jgi:hypothetical protein